MRGVRVDPALIRSSKARYVLAVMTEGSQDLGFGAEHQGAVLIGRLSRAIYDYFSGAQPGC